MEENAGLCASIVREIVSCQISIMFGLVRVSERTCQRDHVREIMSERACQRALVRENMSDRSCQRESVIENRSERTGQRELVRGNVSESTCQRECVRENTSESMSASVSESMLQSIRVISSERA